MRLLDGTRKKPTDMFYWGKDYMGEGGMIYTGAVGQEFSS